MNIYALESALSRCVWEKLRRFWENLQRLSKNDGLFSRNLRCVIS